MRDKESVTQIFILYGYEKAPGIRCAAWGYDRESGASLPKFPYLLDYPRNSSHCLRCNPLLPPSG